MEMKFNQFIIAIFLLCSCNKESMEEVNLSQYFKGISGTAVFYNPAVSQYKIYNILLHIGSNDDEGVILRLSPGI